MQRFAVAQHLSQQAVARKLEVYANLSSFDGLEVGNSPVGEAAIYGYRVLRHASGCSRFDNA